MIKLGIISDTHNQTARTREAVALFKELGVSRVIHCGDIGGPGVIEALREIPTDFVFGNCDAGDEHLLTHKAEETGGIIHIHGWFGSTICENKKIAFLHGNYSERLKQEISSGKWDLICTGHTHQPLLTQYHNTLILNPGSVQSGIDGHSTVCVIEIPIMKAEYLTLP